MKVLHDPTHNPTDQSAFMNPDQFDASANDQESMDAIGHDEPDDVDAALEMELLLVRVQAARLTGI